MRLPDFICVGAQKSGTTWLYEQISRHPQIYMRKKELDFFFRSLDLSWYIDYFKEASPHQLCGDISPNYAAFVGLAEKIHGLCPQALILHILRDPVDRAFSQWKMARFLGNIPRDVQFIEAFRGNLQYMKRRGEYVSIIEEYARYYPLFDRSAVFWFDEIKTRPGALLQSVTTFLGVDPDWQSPCLYDVAWPSPEYVVLQEEDAKEIRGYYEPFDDRLRCLLNVNALPWDSCR